MILVFILRAFDLLKTFAELRKYNADRKLKYAHSWSRNIDFHQRDLIMFFCIRVTSQKNIQTTKKCSIFLRSVWTYHINIELHTHSNKRGIHMITTQINTKYKRWRCRKSSCFLNKVWTCVKFEFISLL